MSGFLVSLGLFAIAMSGEAPLANVVTFESKVLGIKVKVEIGGAERREVYWTNNQGQEELVYRSGDPSTWRSLWELQQNAEEFERFLAFFLFCLFFFTKKVIFFTVKVKQCS